MDSGNVVHAESAVVGTVETHRERLMNRGEVFVSYQRSLERFLDRGGILIWGIVPTNFEPFARENLDSLTNRLDSLWDRLVAGGMDRHLLLSRSMLSPATCCLVNPDREKTVESAFGVTRALSARLREKYRIEDCRAVQ